MSIDADTLQGHPASDFGVVSPATSARNTIQASSDCVPLTLKAKTSQAANLQEWQDSSGNILARFDLDPDYSSVLHLGAGILSNIWISDSKKPQRLAVSHGTNATFTTDTPPTITAQRYCGENASGVTVVSHLASSAESVGR